MKPADGARDLLHLPGRTGYVLDKDDLLGGEQ